MDKLHKRHLYLLERSEGLRPIPSLSLCIRIPTNSIDSAPLTLDGRAYIDDYHDE